jgi:hypothetical protein
VEEREEGAEIATEETAREVGVLIIGLLVVVEVGAVMLMWQEWPFLGRPQRPQL